ncbi:hypothetical protein A3C23_00895 [Candidatus Roizmanbacteria bacterium RIFCSPHIGHO2_02_FULL_37_13b]|uniref:Glycosyltransferase 2-like domain-containing protein n=1 Tax=Candidatus Roizmanbacteria bacterium RIFCSPLOWO2_02_FULL_36_11 TaxID=1802071 RepID=A0A1F7JIV4_9BACT|nr:MAG: hypothetical protein A3C23_00895 [Candidatus Roizmanbacteria bacterium RIFCSPHIGHO2_02_FULL_37_13b]OGK55548.1 MAG: hypothetical protein A3H78_05290 [Candidatus Roizmanbacteria bacterium RIFCSPLOWO2_02_FULL_36_11]
MFNPSSIAIALITYYPKWYRGKLRSLGATDKIRGDLALRTVEQGVKKGYQIIIVDGTSSRSFKTDLRRFSSVHLIKRRINKASPAKRQAIKRAASIDGVKAIVLMEPEKTDLIENHIEMIVKPILKNYADIVIPCRNDDFFRKTYPDYMYKSEVEGNFMYNQILKSTNFLQKKASDFDFFFGPRAFKNERGVVKLFLKKAKLKINNEIINKLIIDPEIYSNSLYYSVIQALKKKLKVLSIEIPFKYPTIQKENEEKGDRDFFMEKRNNQQLRLIVELLCFMNREYKQV